MSFEEIREKLGTETVGIAGAGGLGSNCAVALARIGVGRLIIADFDTIAASNLNRQYYFADQVGLKKVDALKQNIKRIDPYVEVEAYDLKLEPSNIAEIFRNCGVIIEAFDLAVMKQMLAETVIDKLPGKYLVMGCGVAGFGSNNSITTRNYGNIYICGDHENETCDILPPIAPKVGIVANMQANQAVELLLGRQEKAHGDSRFPGERAG